MNNIGVLTVIYHESDEHVVLAKNTMGSMPKDIEKVAIVNKLHDKSILKLFSTHTQNSENCLARAWNIGLEMLFLKYDYVLVMGLDHLVNTNTISDLMSFAKKYPGAGLWSATATNEFNEFSQEEFNIDQKALVKHGDGSFSFFIIHKDAFKKVGKFDEEFRPAYFEDNDYLERLWKSGYQPLRATNIKFYHLFQGTVNHGNEIKQQYPIFMQKNLELFKKKWGKVPDHLPLDIKFN